MDTVAIKPGEIRAGKMRPSQNDYNYFLIRRAGESKDDGSNNLLYVGTMGETDMSLIENRETGDRQFVSLPISRVHPSSIYIENEAGHGEKSQLLPPTDNKQTEDASRESMITFSDISDKRKLLEKLEKIEEKISTIINESNEMTGSDDMDYENNADLLKVLYNQRNKILKNLGIERKTEKNEIENEDPHARNH